MTANKANLNNPFVLAGFYHKDYFCDRESELNELKSHVHNERNVVLYAWRRMGKTALINYFMHLEELENKAETLYIDLLATRNMADAMRQISRAILDKFRSTTTGLESLYKLLSRLGVGLNFDPLTGAPSVQMSIQNTTEPEQSLTEIGTFLMSRKKRVIIAIDEFQQVSNFTDVNGEAIFRSWMQQFPGIRFIFSGSHRQMMTSMFAEKNRPFYRSAQLMSLAPIALNVYEAFILKHFTRHNKVINLAVINSIYAWSRGQTYAIQLVCNKVFGAYQNVSEIELHAVCAEILAQESTIFNNISTLLTQSQWRLLVAIAREEELKNPLSKKFIQKNELGASSSVSTALKKLMETEIVVKADEMYIVQDVLLNRWLQTL